MKGGCSVLVCLFSISVWANPTIDILIPNLKSSPFRFAYDNYSTPHFKINVNDKTLRSPPHFSGFYHPLYARFETDQKQKGSLGETSPAKNWWRLSSSLCASDSKLQCASIMHGERDKPPTIQVIRYNPKSPGDSLMMICRLPFDNNFNTNPPNLDNCMTYTKKGCRDFLKEYQSYKSRSPREEDREVALKSLIVSHLRGDSPLEKDLNTDLAKPFDIRVLQTLLWTRRDANPTFRNRTI